MHDRFGIINNTLNFNTLLKCGEAGTDKQHPDLDSIQKIKSIKLSNEKAS